MLEKGERRGSHGYGHDLGVQARRRSSFPSFRYTTTKSCTSGIIHELLWFLKGDTNIGYLKENGVRIWDEWADDEGNLAACTARNGATGVPDGRTILDEVIEQIKTNPDSRRLIVSAWNVGELDQMALARAMRFSILRAQRRAELSVVSAQCRPVPRRAVQYRWPRTTHSNGRTSHRTEAGRVCAYLWGSAPVLNHLEQAQEQFPQQ